MNGADRARIRDAAQEARARAIETGTFPSASEPRPGPKPKPKRRRVPIVEHAMTPARCTVCGSVWCGTALALRLHPGCPFCGAG